MLMTNTPCIGIARVGYDHGLPDRNWLSENVLKEKLCGQRRSILVAVPGTILQPVWKAKRGKFKVKGTKTPYNCIWPRQKDLGRRKSYSLNFEEPKVSKCIVYFKRYKRTFRKRMKGENRLVSLVENMIEVVAEVVKSLKVVQTKRRCYRPRLCYVCRCPGHLAQSCPSQVQPMIMVKEKDQNMSWKRNRQEKKKRDTNPNEVQNVQIFRCVDEEIKGFRNPETRNGMLVKGHTKNHVSLPNSRQWTKVCSNGSNSGNVRPRASNDWRISYNVK
ncbi:8114_t:CDS:2, partial [Ambispora leptoticha]